MNHYNRAQGEVPVRDETFGSSRLRRPYGFFFLPFGISRGGSTEPSDLTRGHWISWSHTAQRSKYDPLSELHDDLREGGSNNPGFTYQ